MHVACINYAVFVLQNIYFKILINVTHAVFTYAYHGFNIHIQRTTLFTITVG